MQNLKAISPKKAKRARRVSVSVSSIFSWTSSIVSRRSHHHKADDFNKFLVNFLQPEPIDNDNDITMFPTDEDDFMLALLSSTDLINTSDKDRKRTRSSLITDNETLIDNPSTNSDSQSESLNLNRAQNKKSRKWFFLLVGGGERTEYNKRI